MMSSLQLSMSFNIIQSFCLAIMVFRAIRRKKHKQHARSSGESTREIVATSSDDALIRTSMKQVEELRLEEAEVRAEVEALKQERNEEEMSVTILRKLGAPEYQRFWESLPQDLKDEMTGS